jgi:hypothetical protein
LKKGVQVEAECRRGGYAAARCVSEAGGMLKLGSNFLHPSENREFARTENLARS